MKLASHGRSAPPNTAKAPLTDTTNVVVAAAAHAGEANGGVGHSAPAQMPADNSDEASTSEPTRKAQPSLMATAHSTPALSSGGNDSQQNSSAEAAFGAAGSGAVPAVAAEQGEDQAAGAQACEGEQQGVVAANSNACAAGTGAAICSRAELEEYYVAALNFECQELEKLAAVKSNVTDDIHFAYFAAADQAVEELFTMVTAEKEGLAKGGDMAARQSVRPVENCELYEQRFVHCMQVMCQRPGRSAPAM